MWRLVHSDWSLYRLSITNRGICEASGLVEEGVEDFRLVLQSNGDFEIQFAGPQLSYSLLAECAGPCSELDGINATLGCAPRGCGVCDCAMDVEEQSDEGEWSSAETELTMELERLGAARFPYCVAGDSMRFLWEDQRILTFQRVAGTGAPLACHERTQADCDAGRGCSWDTSGCLGEAPSACELSDYGVVPGCEFTNETRCGGTPLDCTAIDDSEQCSETPGCEVGNVCIGGTVDCDDVSTHVNETDCEEQPGCTWSPSDRSCVGEYACEDSIDINQCDRPDIGCIQASCRGTVTSCSELDELTCESVSGCSLQAAICEAGERRCMGSDVMVCSSNGATWEAAESCNTQTHFCDEDSAACVPYSCSPGKKTCDGDLIRTCTADGSGLDAGVACEDGKACYAGECKARLCDVEEKVCVGKNVFNCTQNGTKTEFVEACGVAEACGPAGCFDLACEPNSPLCEGSVTAVCNADGSAIETDSNSVDCLESGRVCVDGDCLDVICEPGEPVCDGFRATTCNSTGTAYAEGGADCEPSEEVCEEGACVSAF